MTQNFALLGPKLRSQGFEPIPVAGKVPTIKGWQEIVLHPEQIQIWAANGQGHHNVGLRTGALAAVDLDIYDTDVADAVFEAFTARFGEAPCRIGREPKRLLVYAAKEPRTKINSAAWVRPNADLDEGPNKVEVLGIGQQFVAAGIHPDTHKPYRWVGRDNLLEMELWMLPVLDLDEVAVWIRDELPKLIPSDWQLKNTGRGGTAFDDDPFASIKQRHDDVDLEGLRWLLDNLDQSYCDERDPWRNVIFAVHHQFHDTEGEAEALELVDAWSAKSPKYVGQVVPEMWKRAHEQRSGGLITIGSLKQWVGLDKWAAYRAQRKAAAAVATVQEQGWEARIAAADQATLEGQIIPEIRVADLTEMTRAALVGKIKERTRALGIPLTLDQIRRLLRPPQVRNIAGLEEAPDIDDWASTAPAWAKDWVWVRTEGKWLNRKTKLLVTKSAFDTEMQRHVADLVVPEGDELRTYEASERMFQHWGAKAVDKEAFHPGLPELFNLGGVTYVNKYRPELRVKPAAAWTDEGRQMARALERHLALLVPDRRCRQLLRSWLAHQYLYPGVKVRWAPLIKGCPGDGKSLLGELMELVLGVDNVKLMNADTIQNSPFSGWVEGQCVTVFEEVKFHGHNRYDVVNKLKPYISNNRVEKHGKGKDPGNILNVTNYLMLTNHEDAIPIEEGDRRYFVLFSPFKTLACLEKVLAADYCMTAAMHFAELFETVRDNPAQLALWLSETEFSPEWDPNMQAPMTEHKAAMIVASRSDLDSAVADTLEDVAAGIKIAGVLPELLSFRHLKRALRMRYDLRDTHDRVLAKVLRGLGYCPAAGTEKGKAMKVMWQGEQVRIWQKEGESISNYVARAALDKSLPGDFDD